MTKVQKILVVEDNDFIRMQVKGFLAEAGYDVDEASDGEAALEKIRDNVALAVVDVRMEPMGGFEFVRVIRSVGMAAPVVMISGDNDPDLLSDSTKLGAAAMLLKPVQKERLVKTVERALAMHERKGGD